jgi:hypothetical protein
VHQYDVKRYEGGFLSAMLAGGRGKDGTDFADQLVLGPQVSCLVNEALHLRRHVAIARGGAEDDCVVLEKIVDPGNRSDLVELVTGGLRLHAGHKFRHPLDVDLGAGDARPFGLCFGHPFDMAEARIVEHQYLDHGIRLSVGLTPHRWATARSRFTSHLQCEHC